ncbi:AEC family transporter [Enterococcus sp. AZ109]|uniref:AEC family transporter n=1 Tax=Enterococcus sp. AZ109 TaxID=2774634 RepID=UPI003F20413D
MIAAQLVFQQLLTMAAIIAISCLLTRKQKLNVEGAQQLSTILLYVVVPALLITSFQREWSIEEFRGLVIAAVLSILYHLLGIVISSKKGVSYDQVIHQLAMVYSNCGFMAFPILLTLYGSNGIFYGGIFVAVFNLFLWSHGVTKLAASKKKRGKTIFLNPGVLPVVIGIIFFIAQIELPQPVSNLLAMLAAVNTPLAMLVIGIYLGPVSFVPLLKKISIWKTTGIRLLLMPLVFFLTVSLILSLLGIKAFNEILQIVTICGACPAASSIILIPSSLGKDGELGAKLVLFSTIFSLFTIPSIVYLVQLF